MKDRIWIVACLALALPTAFQWFETSAIARTGPETTAANDEIPAAALLTDRGTELVQRLQRLRRSESSLGEKHPALPGLRQQISEIQEQLKAWQPAPNPFRRSTVQGSGQDGTGTIPAMNVTDLRQIVLTLAQEVEDLNRQLSLTNDRVKTLERQAIR